MLHLFDKEKLELNEQRIFRQYIAKTLNLDPSNKPQHHRPKSSKQEDGSGDDSDREDSEGEMDEDKIVLPAGKTICFLIVKIPLYISM